MSAPSAPFYQKEQAFPKALQLPLPCLIVLGSMAAPRSEMLGSKAPGAGGTGLEWTGAKPSAVPGQIHFQKRSLLLAAAL